MNYKIVFPEGKRKAITFSYDDGQIHDRRLAALFDQYGLKATFHLNSGTLDTPGFMTSKELNTVYANHEIACHGVQHLWPRHLSKEQMVNEIWEDRKALEAKTGRIVNGMSYAYGEYSEAFIATAKALGIVYSRTVNAIHGFNCPADFMEWHPSVHHNDLFADDRLLNRFLDPEDYLDMPLLYIWGHSFEFEREQTWDKMKALCKKLSFRDDIWYTTNIEYYRYMQAVRALESNTDGTMLCNHSNTPVWICKDGKLSSI